VLPLNEASSKPFTSTLDIFFALVAHLIVISGPVATNFPVTEGDVKLKSVASAQNVVPPLDAIGVVIFIGVLFDLGL
jgi:hypothetical protein